MDLSGSDPARRLRFVRKAEDARPAGADGLTIVLDTAWTPLPSDRPDVRPLRPYVAAVLARHDLAVEALALVDRWAETSAAPEVVTVDGVAYWFRFREELWHWTIEHLLWRYALDAIDPAGSAAIASIPGTEPALLDVARATGRIVEIDGPDPTAPAPVATEPRRRVTRFIPAIVRRSIRRVFPRPETIDAAVRAGRHALLDGRLRSLQRAARPVVLVLSAANLYQRIGGAISGGPSWRDPNLGSVVEALGQAGMQPIVVGGSLDVARPHDWELVEGDDQLLPWDYVAAHWGGPDQQRGAAAVEAIERGLGDVAGTPFLVDGLDVTAAFLRVLRGLIDRTVNADVRTLGRAGQMIEDLRPRAILMTHEGHRVPWLVAGARAGVPTFAVQHGILYSTHPGYANRRHPMLVLPTCTFVYGDYERRALQAGAYRSDEIAVSGSPRLDLLDAPPDLPSLAADRARLRDELGVADGDLMLVVSTIGLSFAQRFHFVHMLETVLGGPLPGVHLVFKQHPSEPNEGPYRALLDGLARAGGYEPPPMSVVREIDLYRLLRAADAHLGHISTVLSDAVVAGTPNLIAIVEPGGDILGYVAAGVARPVHDVAELRAALGHLAPLDPEARRAFIADHFRDGVASERIAATIRAAALDGVAASAAGAA